MEEEIKQEILQNAKEWFITSIGDNHIKNTSKLASISEFNVNPFTFIYLANFLTGHSDEKSIAKALIYPRVLGTSISTSFGTHMQKFTSEVLKGFASTTNGIDIEFIDQHDGRKKYCQLKSGPNTINKDDVETITKHFKDVKNLARTNNLHLEYGDLVVGVVYGKLTELNGHYKRVTTDYDYTVFVGKDFWYRLTGDSHFYVDLIKSIGEVAIEANYATQLDEIIEQLAKNIDVEHILTDA